MVVIKSLSSQEPDYKASPRSGQYLEPILRLLRLQILPELIKPTNETESKKTALHSSHRTAILFGLLHLLPITVCILLVTLNFKTFFIGTVSTEGLTAFQFASKLLEVLIQASITAIVLAAVRNQVLGKSPLPFGGLIAPFRTTDLSLLWSLELWGFFTSPDVSYRIVLCLLFPFAVVLATTIGPSSAVLMIPRPVTHLATNELLLMNPAGVLYPVDIALEDGALISESEYNSTSPRVLEMVQTSFRTPIIDNSTTRDMWYASEETDTDVVTAATIPSSLSANLLSDFGDQYDSVVIRAAQAYVYTDCWCPETVPNSSSTDDQWVDFGPSKQYLQNSIPYTWLMPNSSAVSDNDSFSIMLPAQSDDDPGTVFTTVFSRPPTASANNSLLIAWAIVNATNANELVSTCGCTVDARWALTSTSQGPQSPASEEVSNRSVNDPQSAFFGLEDQTSIFLSPKWTTKAFNSVADRLDYYSATVVASPLLSLALSYVPQASWQQGFATFTGSYTTNQSETNLTNEQYTAALKFIEGNHLLDKYQDVFVLPVAENWTDPTTLAQIEIRAFLMGYGYNTSTKTVRLSLAVVLLYLVMATAHLIHSTTIGIAASSWVSIAELVALALNSEKPQSLHNTSVGISTLETYRQLVNVRVNDEESLEIVFNAKDKSGQYRLVEMNEQY